MSSDSLNRSRASSMSMPQASYSSLAVPRPSPRWSSLRASTESIATSSAKRIGWYQGVTSTAVPRPSAGRRAATCAMNSMGEGVGK